MAKLTDTQTVLLSSAAQRADGSLFPPAATLEASADRIHKAVTALIKATYVEELPTMVADRVWRVDGGQQYGALITDAGRAAISIESIFSEPAFVQPVELGSTPEVSRPTKTALVLTLLRREQGATLAELVKATGWLPHATRAALTGLRKKGHDLAKSKRDEVTCYTLAA